MEAQKDCLVRAISKDGFVNAVAVYTRGLTERARQIHHTSLVATRRARRARAVFVLSGDDDLNEVIRRETSRTSDEYDGTDRPAVRDHYLRPLPLPSSTDGRTCRPAVTSTTEPDPPPSAVRREVRGYDAYGRSGTGPGPARYPPGPPDATGYAGTYVQR